MHTLNQAPSKNARAFVTFWSLTAGVFTTLQELLEERRKSVLKSIKNPLDVNS